MIELKEHNLQPYRELCEMLKINDRARKKNLRSPRSISMKVKEKQDERK